MAQERIVIRSSSSVPSVPSYVYVKPTGKPDKEVITMKCHQGAFIAIPRLVKAKSAYEVYSQ